MDANYILTQAKNITIYYFFWSPWKGKFTFAENDNEFSETEFSFYKDNVFGQFNWSGSDISTTQFSNFCHIGYNQQTYILDASNMASYINELRMKALLLMSLMKV